MGVMKMLFGNYSKRELKRIQPICDQVLALEDKYKAMSDSELQAQTPALKERLAKGETLDASTGSGVVLADVRAAINRIPELAGIDGVRDVLPLICRIVGIGV